MAARKVLHLICQAHLDPVWLWPLRDGVAEALTTMQSAVDRAAETSAFKFTRSSAATYQWIKEMDATLYGRIQKLIQAQRWEVIGGWVEQPDCNLPSAESFLRQGLYGKALFAREFGAKGNTTIGYNPDSFGHTGGLPQLLTHTGFDAYVFMRPEPWDNPNLPLLFWWEAKDGSRVLTQRIPGNYSQAYDMTTDRLEKLVREMTTAAFAPGFDHGAMWLGVGNHGGGPTREHLAKILELQPDMTLPELRFSTVRDYLAAVRKSPALRKLPVIREELGFMNRGCYAATGEVKLMHRACEKALQTAETLDVFAQGSKASPTMLQNAWWRLLFNEFHDILAGTCVSGAQDETRNRFGATLTDARESVMRSAYTLARRVNTRAEKGCVLFAANPLPWARTALVQLDTFIQPHGRAEITHLETQDGQRVPIQWMNADANFGPWGLKWGKLTAALPLPAGGYRVFRVGTKPLDAKPENLITDPTNPQFAQRTDALRSAKAISRQPALKSLKISKDVELLAAPVSTVVIRDTSSTWGHGVKSYRDELGRPKVYETEVLESGPLVTITRQKSRWQQSEIWMDLIRYAHTPHVELRFRFNWQQKRELLKLDISTRLTGTHALAKMPAEAVQRPADGLEYPCHDWVAIQGKLRGKPATLALLNNACYSYDTKSGVLRMILARGVPHAEHPPFDYKDTRNIPFLDQGWQERRFCLVAGSGSPGSLNLERLAQEFQIPAEHMLDNGHPGSEPWEQSTLTIEPANVSVLALKPAEDGRGTVVRLQEMSGKKTRASILFRGRTVLHTLAPWQIVTLRIAETRKGATAVSLNALEQDSP